MLPVPPLAEQKPIVTKVEELLALCDALEARQTTVRERRTRLVHSALDLTATSLPARTARGRPCLIFKDESGQTAVSDVALYEALQQPYAP